MSNCSSLDLSAFVDGELPAEQARETATHCAACPACAAEVRDLRALAAAMLAQPVPEVRELAVSRAVQMARTAASARAPERRPTLWRTLIGLLRARVSIPVPALALGAVILILYALRPGESMRVRVTVVPGPRPAARQAVHEVWNDSELWEQPEVTSGYREIYRESVQL